MQAVGTPRAFLDAVESRFGKLTWDLAADASNHVTPGWFGPGGVYPDALVTPWWDIDGLLWLNPPFSDIAPWAAKCAKESRSIEDAPPGSLRNRHARIAFLVPASVGSNWFAEHVHGKALVLALRPRLTFVGSKDPYPKDLMLALYGIGRFGFDCWKWNERAAIEEPKDFEPTPVVAQKELFG